jgi:hypothetical protein
VNAPYPCQLKRLTDFFMPSVMKRLCIAHDVCDRKLHGVIGMDCRLPPRFRVLAFDNATDKRDNARLWRACRKRFRSRAPSGRTSLYPGSVADATG